MLNAQPQARNLFRYFCMAHIYQNSKNSSSVSEADTCNVT